MSIQFVSTNYETTDGAGFIWDFSSDGSVVDGTIDAFDYGIDLYGFSPSGSLLIVEDGHTYRTLPYVYYSRYLIEREIYVSPTESYVRYVDSVTNVTEYAQTYTYDLNTDFGADGASVAVTSSGDGSVTSDDTWVTVYDSTGTKTPAGLLFGNEAGLGVSDLSMSYDDVSYEYSITLAPGQSVSFMTFAAQGSSESEVSNMLSDLEGLPSGALDNLSAQQIQSIVNWDLPDTELNLLGTEEDDALFGAGARDDMRSFAGDDLIFAGAGDDTISGGFGADTIAGEGGNDLIFGDGTVSQVTTNTTQTLPNSEDISISLTMADAGRGASTIISGFVSRDEVTSDNVDLVFAIDVSGSTADYFSGSVNVGDLNGDGYSNTILDAEIASFEALHESIISDANLPDANLTIVPFESSSATSQTFTATQDDNNNGVADVLEYVRGLQDYGGTDFESALQATAAHFTSSNAGQQILYFLSDGGNNEGGALNDDVQVLLDMGVQIQSLGVGTGAVEYDLDIVDDNTDNGSTTIVLDPAALTDELLDPGIEAADIVSLQVFLNGIPVETIDPEDLMITPFGLRYFELELVGLNTSADDIVEVRATANDGANTVISASQTLEHLSGSDRADLLIGGLGRDTLDGGSGNDTLMGGRGADELNGGSGQDFASYADADSGVVVDLSGRLDATGEASGDELLLIENLIGSGFDDTLVGTGGKTVLRGLAGDDNLDGSGGKDKLNGGQGDDTLTGGAGKDIFIFNANGGSDIITDFARNLRGEKIDLRDFDIDSFADLKDLMSRKPGGNTLIEFDTGDTLLIEDVRLAQFQANDFLL